MKITMYELLGMVKSGNAPKKIKYINSIWKYDEETKDYFNKDCFNNAWLIHSMNSIGLIEREVEILEEEKKIPEKLDHLIGYDIQQFDDLKEYVEIATNDLFGKVNKVIDTLNQLIDYLKSKGE